MKLSEICIQRPVLAWVMTLVLVILGIVGGTRLSLQQYPTIDRPFVTIETNLPGAGPEIVEFQVTKIIEEAIAGIEGIIAITSVSSTEDSKVIVEFSTERKIDEALNDLRQALDKAKEKIPDEASDITFSKTNADEKPVITLALTSQKVPASELADYAFRELQKDLESLGGVARVDVLGAGQYIMQVHLDPNKLAAQKIGIEDVIMAIKRQNFEKPAGKITSNNVEYLITTVSALEKPEEFQEIIVASKDAHLVKLKDVASSIKISADDRKTKSYFGSEISVTIGVIKQSTANLIDVVKRVKDAIPMLQAKLPEGVSLQVATDRSLFVERSISQVYKTIFEATFLVVIVIIAFLQSIRASLIPLVTIPVSLISTFFLMYLLNFSINTLTLMAVVLAIGLVVDDAIIVLENIYRYIEKGMKPFEATVKGIREISFAVIATTLTLAAVYIPVALAPGFIGRLFTEFAFSLAGAVIISGFAALTLSPMMCARMLRPHQKNPQQLKGYFKKFQRAKDMFESLDWLPTIEKKYDYYLQKAFDYRIYTLGIGLGFALLGGILTLTLPQTFTPNEDGGYMSLEGHAPQAATLEYTDRYLQQINKILSMVPEVERRVTQINNPTFDGKVQLYENRKRSTDEIVEELKPKLRAITGVEARIESSGGGVSGTKSRAIEFVVAGNTTNQEIQGLTRMVAAYMYRSGKFDAVRTDIRSDNVDYIISIDAPKAKSLGVEPGDLAKIIESSFRGQKAGTFKKEGKLHDVKVQLAEEFRRQPEDILNLYVKVTQDKEEILIPVSELGTIEARTSPAEIHHYNRLRSVQVKAELAPSLEGIGEAISVIKDIEKEVLPQGVRIEFTGDTLQFLKEGQNVFFVFALALCFIYLVMAAQFESWRDPFIIMLSVPLSLASAVITLSLISNGSLNIYSQIGLVTLIGLITKHGIMMVDFANHLKEEGRNKFEAILEASKLRLRPILMTTFATVLGAVPLAFATGAGFESRRQIGWVIVGGMSIGTLFTLFILPVVYTYLTTEKKHTAIKEVS